MNPKLILMKSLKITLALVAIAVLTVSGVQSDKIVADNTEINQPTKIDLLASGKKLKTKLPSQG
jgi:hypothetical protein